MLSQVEEDKDDEEGSDQSRKGRRRRKWKQMRSFSSVSFVPNKKRGRCEIKLRFGISVVWCGPVSVSVCLRFVGAADNRLELLLVEGTHGSYIII